MNYLKISIPQHLKGLQNYFRKSFVLSPNTARQFSETAPKISTEKSINKVTLLGRVGINPQLRGTETKPMVVFTLATNTNYKYEQGDIQQKTDWHRIGVFKPYLRDMVLDYLKKGSRIYVEGRILYGEFSDSKGVLHNTTTIVASDIVFLSDSQKKSEEMDSEDMESSMP